MDRGHGRLLTLVGLVAIVAGACATTDPGSTLNAPASASLAAASVSSVAPTDVVTQEPILAPTDTPEPADTPTPTPTDVPSPTPTPTSTPRPSVAPAPGLYAPAGWTAPERVGTGTYCDQVTAEIDATSRVHIAASCQGTIRYYVSNGLGGWGARTFAHAARRSELGPRIAFMGDRVFVAYTRISDEGCGGPADVGVYYRSRILPNGAWSAATRLGAVGDSLQDFKIDGATLHATVRGEDQDLYYEMLAGHAYHRYPIHSAIQTTALAIGSDGLARIAYEVPGGLRLAVFTGSGFTTTRIGTTNARDWGPQLALDGADQAHVLWTRSPQPGGCAGEGPRSSDGTFYGSNASGSWSSRRITGDMGLTSLAFNATTGRAYVLVEGQSGMWYYAMSPSGSWTRTRVATTMDYAPVIRLDPTTGTLLIVYIAGSSGSTTRIVALTRTEG